MARAPAIPPSSRARSSAAAPLTEAQDGIWHAQRLDQANPIFNTGQYLDIIGKDARKRPEALYSDRESADHVHGLAAFLESAIEAPTVHAIPRR